MTAGMARARLSAMASLVAMSSSANARSSRARGHGQDETRRANRSRRRGHHSPKGGVEVGRPHDLGDGVLEGLDAPLEERDALVEGVALARGGVDLLPADAEPAVVRAAQHAC